MADLSTRPEPTTDVATGDAPAPPTPSSDGAESAPGASSESPSASEPNPAAPPPAAPPPAAPTTDSAPSEAKADASEADGPEIGVRAEDRDPADKSGEVSTGSGELDAAVPTPRRKRPRPSVLVTSLAALLVALVGAGVALMLHNRALTSAADDRTAALQVAQAVATGLTTFSPEDAASQIQTLNTESTGSFRDQIAGYSEAFQAVLKQGNVTSTGAISAAGIEKLDGDTAAALVTVAARLTSAQNAQGEPRSYRLTIELQRNDDKWLASNVSFVP